MSKGSWKKRLIGADRVREALIRAGGNVSQTATELEISRSTLHRWLLADSSLAPRRSRPVRHAQRSVDTAPKPGPSSATPLIAEKLNSPEGFQSWVLERFEMSPAEHQLLACCVEALRLARDSTKPDAVRLGAMREFRAGLSGLGIPITEEENEIEDSQQVISIRRRG